MVYQGSRCISKLGEYQLQLKYSSANTEQPRAQYEGVWREKGVKFARERDIPMRRDFKTHNPVKPWGKLSADGEMEEGNIDDDVGLEREIQADIDCHENVVEEE